MSEVIESFVRSYLRTRDFYENAASICHEQCRDVLTQNGIRQLVTYRAKRGDRLREKLYQRHEGREYSSEEDILRDLRDLAGVRVALYFPGDRSEATRLLSEQFELIREPKQFPDANRKAAEGYAHRFLGYSATHLNIRLKLGTLTEERAQYREATVEIQIASLFMHAWAEVEHDLVYKPFQGLLSEAEYALLDQANGLAYSGEIALEQLQATIRQRLAGGLQRSPNEGGQHFQNHYELASFIHTALTLSDSGEFRMGRADLLLRLLRLGGLDQAEILVSLLKSMPVPSTRHSVVEQIAEHAFTCITDPAQSERLKKAWQEIRAADDPAGDEMSPNERAAIAAWGARERFESHWRNVEAALLSVLAVLDEGHRRAWLDSGALSRIPGLTSNRAACIAQCQEIFHRLAQRGASYSPDELTARASELGEILQWIHTQYPR